MQNLTSPSILMAASNQWASRPADQRFVSLTDLHAHTVRQRQQSKATTVASKSISLAPLGDDHKGLVAVGPSGEGVGISHFAFGQLCSRVKAPAAYLRNLPSEMAADCVNYGLVSREVEEVGVLLSRLDPDEPQGPSELRAATGPNYGRIWNAEITRALINQFGDGVTGNFRVPGIFGKPLDEVTKENTTLYAGDRDMFVFLADEENRIEMPNRRDGKSGSLARGFFVWNSEVGSSTFGVATFLFDYVCSNRVVWSAQEYAEIKLRHTSSAPGRFIEEVTPALKQYVNSSSANVTKAIEAARRSKIDEDVSSFLTKRFGKQLTQGQIAGAGIAHQAEEGRPIETLWDAATGITAYARNIANQDDRVAVERVAGKVLDLASA